MHNRGLIQDYAKRAEIRLKAIATLYAEESWADVVRESQEAVELALKALLRAAGIEVPRIHDVSGILLKERDLLPQSLHKDIEQFAAISKNLCRDRELAYGSEDLTPSEFYNKRDADQAFKDAKFTVMAVKGALPRE